MCVYVCMRVCVCVCVHACVRAFVRDVFAIYDNNILPRLIMIIIKIISLYLIEIAHTDNFPSTGTRLVYDRILTVAWSFTPTLGVIKDEIRNTLTESNDTLGRRKECFENMLK